MQRHLLCLARALIMAALAVFSGCGTGTEPPPTQCSGGQTDCSGTCRDLQTDEASCGACGNACASGQSCEQGQCRASPPECATGLSSCNGACVNLQSNAAHCGACGNLCASGACSAGECVPVGACKDGRITAPEGCDDGNEQAGDGCSASCAVEPGWACEGEPSRCHRAELEPNNSLANATEVPVLPLWIRGAITPGADVDVFRITLSGVADLRLDTFDGTYDGSGPERCGGLIDTELELLDQSGTVLISDDDGGLNRCSSIDSVSDEAARRLAPGTYFVRVSSVGADPISAYTLRIQLRALCGDGIIQASEQCDDGNSTDGDRCSATCQLEKTAEAESNDTSATAEQLPLGPALIGGAITPGTDVDMFRLTVPATVDLRVDTFDGSYTGGASETCESIDTVIELIAADGTTVLAWDDEGGLNHCSSLNPAYYWPMRRLPAGTYFVRVTSYQEQEIAAYSLLLRYVAVCGDGAVTGYEECDGTASCTATCERVPVCGDGFLDFPEACEDGNTANGDGCSSACKVPGLQDEVEPNDTFSQADDRAGGPQPVLITGGTGFSSAFATVGDMDVYKMQVEAPQVVRLETFHGGLNQCASGLDSTLWLETTDQTLAWSDDQGIGRCSAIVLSVQAGTYYVSASRYGGGQAEPYLLEVAFQSDAGSESEGNDTLATANPVSGTDSFISGSIPATTDVDYFRISVAQGQSLRAELIEGGAKSCSAYEMEPKLTLFDEAGVELTSDVWGGRGSCALIEGLEPWHSSAGNLPAGNYYLRVSSSEWADAEDATFDYRLSITLR